MTFKINQVRGAVRYNGLKRFGPSLTDFGHSGNGKVFWAPDQISTAAGQYCDLRSALTFQWFVNNGIYTIARYNINDSSDGGFGYVFPNNNKWPKKNYALRVPKVVRFLVLTRNAKYANYKNAFASSKSILENDSNYSKRVYVLDTDQTGSGVPDDLASNRFMAAFCPIAKYIPPDEDQFSETKFLGTDVLNIVILNLYDIFWYGANSQTAKFYQNVVTGPFVDLSYAAWIKHNMEDVIRYKRAFRKYKKITTWVYTDNFGAPSPFSLIDPRPFKFYTEETTGTPVGRYVLYVPVYKGPDCLFAFNKPIYVPGFPNLDDPNPELTPDYTVVGGYNVDYYIGDSGIHPSSTLVEDFIGIDGCIPSFHTETSGAPPPNIEGAFIGGNNAAIQSFCDDLSDYNVVFKGQAPSDFTSDIRNYFNTI